MILERIVRGNLIEFAVTFLDADGVDINPTSATLSVSFLNQAGVRDVEEIEMTGDTDGVWTGTWDSSGAKKGRVYWSVRSFSPASADDGEFELDANLANPAPEST